MSSNDIREALRALPRTDKFDPRYPIYAYEDDLVALIDQAVLAGKKAELQNVIANSDKQERMDYCGGCDGYADRRLAELNKLTSEGK